MFHKGIDIRASVGDSVYSIASGTVTWAQTYSDGNLAVHIKQSIDGKMSRYLHLSSKLVSVGQLVGEGVQIGKAGATGEGVTGPHLHFDLGNNFPATEYYHPLKYLDYTNTGPPAVTSIEIPQAHNGGFWIV
ncbi:M23 family metallopeptidase, partial [bacterium]|nr:M23 family metallopeptidase [bacterium]